MASKKKIKLNSLDQRQAYELVLLAGLLGNSEVSKRYSPDQIIQAAKNYLHMYLDEEIEENE